MNFVTYAMDLFIVTIFSKSLIENENWELVFWLCFLNNHNIQIYLQNKKRMYDTATNFDCEILFPFFPTKNIQNKKNVFTARSTYTFQTDFFYIISLYHWVCQIWFGPKYTSFGFDLCPICFDLSFDFWTSPKIWQLIWRFVRMNLKVWFSNSGYLKLSNWIEPSFAQTFYWFIIIWGTVNYL